MCLAYQSGSNTGIWDMTEGGGVINGREYSQHAMERMVVLCQDLVQVKMRNFSPF